MDDYSSESLRSFGLMGAQVGSGSSFTESTAWMLPKREASFGFAATARALRGAAERDVFTAGGAAGRAARQRRGFGVECALCWLRACALWCGWTQQIINEKHKGRNFIGIWGGKERHVDCAVKRGACGYASAHSCRCGNTLAGTSRLSPTAERTKNRKFRPLRVHVRSAVENLKNRYAQRSACN